jgi:hypothetical protein
MFDVSYVAEIIPKITRDVLYTKSYKKLYAPLRVKKHTPPAQIKITPQTQPGITYAQVSKQNSYAPTDIGQEPHKNQSYARFKKNIIKSLFEQMRTMLNLPTTVLTELK